MPGSLQTLLLDRSIISLYSHIWLFCAEEVNSIASKHLVTEVCLLLRGFNSNASLELTSLQREHCYAKEYKTVIRIY